MKVPKNELHFPGIPGSGTPMRVIGEDVNKTTGTVTSVTTTAVAATGSNTVQFVFNDAKGNPLAFKTGMLCYLSDVNGAPVTAVTSLVVATNGGVDQLVTGKVALVTTTTAGLLGITVTGSAATRYLTFVLPTSGKLLTSGAITIN